MNQKRPYGRSRCRTAQVERRGAIAVLTLNRPDKRNAPSDELVLGLQAILSTIPSDVQGVVMCGAGDNFCAVSTSTS
jgi:enoyl-CoA hydratase/carnithine racemase